MEIKAGEWYFGVYCPRCLWPIVLFHDPSRGGVKFAGPGKLDVTCPRPDCGHQHYYTTGEVVSLEAQQVDSPLGPRPPES